MLRAHVIDGPADRRRIAEGLRSALGDVVQRPSASLAAFLVGTDLEAAAVARDDGTIVLAVGRGRELPGARRVPLALDAAGIEDGDPATALPKRLDEATDAAAARLV